MTLLLAVERPSWSSGATGGIGPAVRGTREASTQKLNYREQMSKCMVNYKSWTKCTQSFCRTNVTRGASN